MIKIDRIPEISDKELLKRLQELTPLISKIWEEGSKQSYFSPKYYKLIFDKKDLNFARKISFTWEPKFKEQVFPINRCEDNFGMNSPTTIITYHRYGAPAFFKPSLAEVVAQLPKNFKGAFCIDPKDMNSYNIVDDHHFVKTFLWEELR